MNGQSKIDLKKSKETLGYWSFAQLEKRLREKHARAAFINAEIRTGKVQPRTIIKSLYIAIVPT
jgi:hypothetical protein